MLKITQKAATKNSLLPALALPGILMYNKPPSTKKMIKVVLRPKKSDKLAQKNRPPILNKLNNAVKPAAIAAIAVS